MSLERMNLNLDRDLLQEAQEKAAKEIGVKIAGNKSLFIRWLILNFLNDGKK